MVLQDIVVQTTVLDNIVTACRKTLPYAVAFTVEGSLKISLVTSEIIVIDVNETGEGKFKKRAKKKETINRTEDGITPPVPKRKRGRPRKVNYQEPVSESENDGDIVDNDTSGILGSESEIPDIKLETVEGVKEEVAESSDILNQQAELGMQALQSLAMQLSGEGDASSQPIEPSSSDLPATDQPPSDMQIDKSRKLKRRGRKPKKKDGKKSAYIPRKIFKCSFCDKKFSRDDNRVNHERIHTGEKPYICGWCGKGFNQRDNLKQHERIHTGEKPFQCRYCGKSFAREDNMKQHERIHTGEKPYSCQVCNKRFTQPGVLKRHYRMHTGEKPYQCTYCGKRFTREGGVRRHEGISHRGERPYQCSVCNKRFGRETHLQRHEKTHTGEKPYLCMFCSKGFAREDRMKAHERKHGDSDGLQPMAPLHRLPQRPVGYHPEYPLSEMDSSAVLPDPSAAPVHMTDPSSTQAYPSLPPNITHPPMPSLMTQMQMMSALSQSMMPPTSLPQDATPDKSTMVLQ